MTSDPVKRGREIAKRAAAAAATAAVDSVPAVAIPLRAALAALDEIRLTEIIEEATVQTVIASIELCDEPLLRSRLDAGGLGAYVLMPWLTLRQFAAALRENAFVPVWEPGPRAWVLSAEISRRWDDVPESIETARRVFNTELGGAYLLPKDGATAVGRTRAQLRSARAVAERAKRAAAALAHLDMNGGLVRYVDRTRDEVLEASVAMMFILEDILAAHDTLITAARTIAPTRVDALLAPAPVQRDRASDAMRELMDNARQALVDAGDELNGWRARSSLHGVGDLNLCRIAAATDLHFTSEPANSWLSLGHTIDSARVRCDALTFGASLEVESSAAALRETLLKSMGAAENAAQQISSAYRAVDEAKARGRSEPLDTGRVDRLRAEFHQQGKTACDAVDQLDALARGAVVE